SGCRVACSTSTATASGLLTAARAALRAAAVVPGTQVATAALRMVRRGVTAARPRVALATRVVVVALRLEVAAVTLGLEREAPEMLVVGGPAMRPGVEDPQGTGAMGACLTTPSRFVGRGRAVSSKASFRRET